MTLPEHHRQTILDVMGASELLNIETIQSLWSGYGEIVRVQLVGGIAESVIAKWVSPPSDSRHPSTSRSHSTSRHPRGWNSDNSHLRKLRSYRVESYWYSVFSKRTNESCRVAKCYHGQTNDDEHLFLLEDLDAVGYDVRHGYLNTKGVQLGLAWLAHFHAMFLGCPSDGLWKVGTYWHLDTRPDELAVIQDGHPLKQHAVALDQALSNCPIQTIVHGDAKVANFCFANDANRVAAVDFQYVGGGCGMKDVAYFLGSCLDEDQCDRDGEAHLNFYFAELNKAVRRKPETKIKGKQVEAAWRPLYSTAWADFHRFLLGWCPSHQKIHGYTKRMTEEAIKALPNT